MRGRRVLITGASGFIGGALARAMLERGARVSCPVRAGSERGDQLEREGARVERLGRIDAQTLRAFDDDPPEVVVHLAASGVRVDERATRDLMEGHARLTVDVVEAAARWGVERVVHAGSWSELAPPVDGEALTHASPIGPTSRYGVAKASATMWARQLAAERGVELVVARLFNVFGEGEAPGRLFAELIGGARSGQTPSLTSGRVVRDFVYVEDAAEALAEMAARGRGVGESDTLLVCSGVGVSVREVVEEVARQAEAPWLLEGLGARPDRADEPPRIVGDPGHTREVLGWGARVDVREAVRRMLARG